MKEDESGEAKGTSRGGEKYIKQFSLETLWEETSRGAKA
jgi:hypothetical protein